MQKSQKVSAVRLKWILKETVKDGKGELRSFVPQKLLREQSDFAVLYCVHYPL